MCPACLTWITLWAAGASSAGGLGWVLVRRLSADGEAKTRKPEAKEVRHESN